MSDWLVVVSTFLAGMAVGVGCTQFWMRRFFKRLSPPSAPPAPPDALIGAAAFLPKLGDALLFRNCVYTIEQVGPVTRARRDGGRVRVNTAELKETAAGVWSLE